MGLEGLRCHHKARGYDARQSLVDENFVGLVIEEIVIDQLSTFICQ